MKYESAVGIILAGGRGVRLASETPLYTKTLLEIGGIPVVGYGARALAMHVEEVVAVTGPSNTAGVVEAVTAGLTAVAGSIAVIPAIQKEPLGVAHAIKTGLEKVRGDRPVVVICGDNIVESNDVKNVLEQVRGGERPNTNMINMAWTYKEFEPATAKRFAVWTPIPGHPGKGRLVEKPANPASRICWCGPVAFRSGREAAKRIRGLTLSARGEYEVTELLNTYLQENEDIKIPLEGKWFDIGTPEALREAGTIMSNKTNLANLTEEDNMESIG